MRRHPEYSRKILSNLNFLSPIIPIILYHHKRLDDKDSSFENMPERARIATKILTVADAFDAMTSNRPYRNKMSYEQALAEIERCSGTQFDEEVVRAFKSVSKFLIKS